MSTPTTPTSSVATTGFSMGSGDPNSDTQAWAATPVPSETSPRLSSIFLKILFSSESDTAVHTRSLSTEEAKAKGFCCFCH